MSCQNNMQFCLSPKVYKYNPGFNKLVFFSNHLRWIPQSGDSHSPSRKFTRPNQKFFRYSYKKKEGQKNWAILQLHSQTCWFCIAESATTSIFNYCKCQWFEFSSHGNKRSISNGLYDFDLVLSLLVFVLLLLPTN